MVTTKENILKTLAYFDIFQYPLKRDEILLFYPSVSTQQAINTNLDALVEEGKVYILGEFFSLQNNPLLAERRRKGNAMAVEEMKKARRAARILSRFPFVEGLAISGSLSKNFADENTDIDFFIITKTNRLWVARTFMHIFYKLARLTRSQRLFCMNYYVDEQGMEIPEQNVFTAMEIITLVPVQGAACVENFSNNNQWTKKYFPSYQPVSEDLSTIKKGIFRKMAEWILGGKTGDRLNTWLRRKTEKRWEKKLERKEFNSKGICMDMLAGEHFSKPDPQHFQYKILAQYEFRLKQLLKDPEEIHSIAV